MQFSVTFRQMETSDKLKDHAFDRVKRLKKYFPDPITANVVLGVERYRQKADVNIMLHNGLMLKGQDVSEDMYQSIDKAMDKIERQIRKYKDRIRRHKPKTGPNISVRHNIVQAAAEPEFSVEAEAEADEVAMPRVIRTSEFSAKPMSLEEAIMQLELRNSTFLVFANSDTGAINVVYRREDGDYGLIETAAQSV
ncbi:MAG: ribosome-associated translation inhibitor RaiA [Deltaproteobacteria bacterium]|nr:ribosome-associated translation inhibitor RaiA [Deltaproteobacteria bacterium]